MKRTDLRVRKGFKKSIIDYLSEEGLYHASDDKLIDELIFNFDILENARQDLEKRGLVIDGKRNVYLEIYNTVIRTVKELEKHLNLSPYDRKKSENAAILRAERKALSRARNKTEFQDLFLTN